MLQDDPIITKVLPRRRPLTSVLDEQVQRLPHPYDSKPADAAQSPNKLKLAWQMVPHIYTTLKGLIMGDWKTTISGIVAGAAFAVHAIWGVYIPELVTDGLIAIALFALGYNAPDKKKGTAK